MALFAIADLHLSLSCDKPMDVFPGWKDYVARLEKNWRALVKEEDTVVIAGDISWAMKLSESYRDFAFLHSLPGQKLILKGNHDYWWSTKSKIETFFQENGFNTLKIVHNSACRIGDFTVCGTRGWLYNAETEDDVKIVSREAGRLNLSLDAAEKLGGEPVAFLHYPPIYDGMECREILDVLENRHVKRCYFGHIHGADAAKRVFIGEYRGIQMQLVACDFLQFIPRLVQ